MFGDNLAELRKESGYDQKKLGELLGVSYHTISSYERGRSQPNHEMLIRIAELFDVSLDYLLGLRRDRVSYKEQNNVKNTSSFSSVTRTRTDEWLKKAVKPWRMV